MLAVTADRMKEAFEWLSLDERLVGFLPVVPLAVCLLGVHLCFRHFVSIAWFSVKFILAIVVYLQIQDIVSSFMQTSNPWSTVETFCSLPIGIINTASVLGFRIIKTKILIFLHECCRGCSLCGPTTLPPEEYTSWVDWMGRILFI